MPVHISTNQRPFIQTHRHIHRRLNASLEGSWKGGWARSERSDGSHKHTQHMHTPMHFRSAYIYLAYVIIVE